MTNRQEPWMALREFRSNEAAPRGMRAICPVSPSSLHSLPALTAATVPLPKASLPEPIVWPHAGLLGRALLVVSVLALALLAAVPFAPLAASLRATLLGVLLVGGELAFWAGALLAGPELVREWKEWLNPRTWLRRR
jgi:hypothetical protein